MDVPSSHAGVVKEVKVKVGDAISEGDVVILLSESGASASAAVAPATKAPTTPSSASAVWILFPKLCILSIIVP